jgi:tetratricopeptide (TPR) repeat protein
VTLTTSRELFAIAKLSLDLGYEDLGASLLEHLLEQLPGHVAARCMLGDTFAAKQRWDEAEEQFQYPLTVDPLNLWAVAGLASVELAKGCSPEESEHVRKLRALHPYTAESTGLLETPLDESSPLTLARILTWSGRTQDAVPFYEAACDQETEDPQWRAVLELLLAQALWAIERVDRARPLIERLVEQQDMWVRPKLILADIALQNRDDALGVSLAHDATALDPSSTVAQELLGGDERYEWLFERGFELAAPTEEALDGAPNLLKYLLIGQPLPAPLIAQEGGEDQLVTKPRSDRHRQKGRVPGPTDDSVSQSQSAQLLAAPGTLDDAAAVGGPEEKTQVRLILTSRDRVVDRYGEDGYEELDGRLSALCEAVARSTGDESIKLSVDDDSCLAEFGLTSVDPSDPCQIAALIGELDATLKGQSISVASLLIVGGDAIVPFHRLPNPADDEDPTWVRCWGLWIAPSTIMMRLLPEMMPFLLRPGAILSGDCSVRGADSGQASATRLRSGPRRRAPFSRS